MNTEQFRRSLRAAWLQYYRENRAWLTRLGVWVTCEGQRRPSSSFILASLSVLEPELLQLLPLIVDLSSNPDRIVIALGLNFNPDSELERFEKEQASDESPKMLPAGNSNVDVAIARAPIRRVAMADESCQGVRGEAESSQRRSSHPPFR